MTQTITLSPFEPSHIDAALELSKAVYWPHRAQDWAMLLELGHGVVALEGDTVVGTALGCGFGPDLAVVNMIIVEDSRQGKGLGRKLMEAVLPQNGSCRLVATAEGLPLYEKLGFQATGEIMQFQGELTDVAPADGNIRPFTSADLDQVIALETGVYGGDRTALTTWLAAQAKLVVSTAADGQITGYAAARDFGRGHVIGPVTAPDEETAKALIATAAQDLKGQFVRIDTCKDLGLGPWIETMGLAHVGGGTAMQRGDGAAPAPRYALFSQALG